MARTTRKMTDNPVVQCIVGLIREQGRNEKDLTDYIGIASGETELIRTYRSFDEGRKRCIRDVLEYFKGSKRSRRKTWVAEDEIVEKPLL